MTWHSPLRPVASTRARLYSNPMKRLQRLRATVALRDMTSEIGFGVSHLIQPLFLSAGATQESRLAGLPGNSRHTLASLLTQFEKDLNAGVRQFLLFPVPAHKSNRNFNADFTNTALQQMRQRAGNDAAIWVDTCLCSFTESGHCCVHDSRGGQDLAATHAALALLGVGYVKAGANGISPSDMNDGRVAHLRAALDGAGYDLAPIMSYSTKFASNYYGPFRDAADSAPQFGDRTQLSTRRAQSQRRARLQPSLRGRGRGPADGETRPARGRPDRAHQGADRAAVRRLPGERRIHLARAARREEIPRLRSRPARELVQPASRRRLVHHHVRRATRERHGPLAVRYFPLFLDIAGKPVLLVGGGEVAARKYALLKDAGAKVTVVAPVLGEELARRARGGRS